MKLKPLGQWICDVCGEVIQSPKDGYVQWNRNLNQEIDDFVIVHHFSASPKNTIEMDAINMIQIQT
ncbi:hypothetical protein [Ruminiclostridium josui]|uniref:hypothetical protein n=1 Tax=Ruminiclostridium josui TaxID=1499 RepID=UPI0006D22E8D|nr:hypothetical protein [Ruminiclostridium josui]